eukprot:5975552-Pleurochrysis_carterae.AAC.1
MSCPDLDCINDMLLNNFSMRYFKPGDAEIDAEESSTGGDGSGDPAAEPAGEQISVTAPSAAPE